jgi:acetyl esterase/lipase
MPAADDLEGWREGHTENEAEFEEFNTAVVDEYKPEITPRELGGVPVLEVTPQNWRDNGKVLVYAHGGSYTFFSAASTLISCVPVANDTGLKVISVDYTLAPFAKFHRITDQVIAVIEVLLEQGYTMEDIAMYGESAGGSLVAGTVLKMRDQGMAMPAAAVLWSPWSDITETGDTYHTLKDFDPAYLYGPHLKTSADAYADPEDQKHPYVSPIYGDYSKGFPPTLIQGGTREIFLSNFVRHYQVLDQAGVAVKLDLYEGMFHAFQALGFHLPESQIARGKMSEFLKQHLGG